LTTGNTWFYPILMSKNYITEVIKVAGLRPVARACGKTYQAVRKWEARGRLPWSDYVGETRYAEILSDLVDGQITVEQLRPPLGSRQSASS